MIRVFKIILINLILLFVGLLIIEKLLPVISLPIYSERTINLREHSPNQNKTFTIRNTGDKVDFFTDSDGFLNENENGFDSVIIFFGGSTVENIQVEYEERFTYKLQSKINKDTSKKTRVLNGGVSGNNNFNSLFSFISKGLKYRPEYIFLMGTLNDVGQLSRYNSYWELDNNQSILNSSKSKTYLFLNYLKTFWFTNIYYHLKSLDFLPRSSNLSSNEFKFNEFSKEEYLRIINLFSMISKEFGVNFIFLTEPFLDIPNQEKSIVKSLNKKILESGLSVIDLESLIPKEKKYFIDNTHLNKEGNELASNIIYEYLKVLSK